MKQSSSRTEEKKQRVDVFPKALNLRTEKKKKMKVVTNINQKLFENTYNAKI